MKHISLDSILNVPGFLKVMERRDRAVRSLLKSLKHLSRERQFAVLTSWIDIERLEELVKFQEKERK